MVTTTMPILIGGLGIIDIETQCKAIKAISQWPTTEGLGRNNVAS